MRKNIYIKSMLRQPMRTLLLFLLIALASFAFVLRAVEFISVNRHVQSIAANYRSIGFLLADSELGDVTVGAEILANSSFVAYEDRRRQVEGVLQDGLFSPDFLGMTRGRALEDQTRFSVSYFYGQLMEVDDRSVEQGIIWLNLLIEEVLSGQPQHTIARQRVWLRFQFDPEETGAASWVEDMRMRGRYFFKAHYYLQFNQYGLVFPRAQSTWDWLDLMPVDSGNLWVIPLEPGQHVDFDALGLSHIPHEIELLRHNQQAVTLQTTIDMTAMPSFQGRGSAMRLSSGRMLNIDDHLNANPVAVIHSAFAYFSRLRIGDTITVAVHENQFIDGVVTGSWADGGVQITEPVVRSLPDAETVHMIELEIVGFYNNFVSLGMNYGWGIVYVPDSVIPAHLFPQPPVRDLPQLPASWHEGFLPGQWYSFVLECTRVEQTFLTQYREIMAEHNLLVVLFQAGSGGFWAAADPILLIVAFNAVVFMIVLLLVLLLVAFLYLRQRRRDYAIMRALGRPNWRIALQLTVSVLLFCVPAAVLGSYFSWNFAIAESRAVLEPLAEMAVAEAVNIHDPFNRINAPAAIRAAADVDISIVWLIGLIGVVVGLLLVVINTGFAIALRYSVLEQLQGNTVGFMAAKQMKPTAAISDTTAPVFTSERVVLPSLVYTKTPSAKAVNGLRWVSKHIARSATKTVLGFTIALFFVMALGWMQESIRSTEANVDYLYDNTIVRAEVEPAGTVLMGGSMVRGLITRMGGRTLDESRYVYSTAREAVHLYSSIFPTDAYGGVPYNWEEIVGFNRNVNTQVNMARGALNTLLAISNLDEFIAEHYVGVVGDGADMVPTIQVEFLEGFGPADFVFDSLDVPIPLVIPQSLVEQRGLALGDVVVLAYGSINMVIHNIRFVDAVVIGIHNEYIFRTGHSNSSLIPVAALEELTGWVTFYTHIGVTINPAYNREITSAREDITERISRSSSHIRPVEMLFMDEELRVVVGAMGQVLLLLELMYPIVIVLAVVIGAALSMLFMLQVAKNAAIMRVLGATRRATRVMLSVELMAVCLGGVIVGLGAMIAMSWGFGTVSLISVAAFYLAGAIVGSIAGAIVVTAKPPLDLLQVRE